MLRLTVLGQVSLRQSAGGTEYAQRGWQRSALLALLAGSGRQGVGREQIASLLWPDSSIDQARHSLDDLLSRLRRETNEKELFSGTTRLLLNDAAVAVDSWEFETAISLRRYERAVELYKGAFADGLRVSKSNEAELKIDAIRRRLASALSVALEALAKEATERHNGVEAVRWWQKLADEEPLSGRVACELIAALAAAGENAQALRAARVHATLVRQQLGTAPDRQVEDWIARLTRNDRVATPVTAVKTDPRIRIDSAAGDDRREARIRAALGARYRIDELLEEGTVLLRYAARDVQSGMREVHVSVLHPRVASLVKEARFVEAFERARGLSGAQILPTLDFGIQSDVVYVVTPPMQRVTLREMLRKEGALSIEETLNICKSLAQSLATAHRHGLVHGDLRPKHIGVTDAREIVVGGFGLMVALRNDSSDDLRTTALAVGSPRYLSPEQLEGKAADSRSDVFAFGRIAEQMLTGEASSPTGRYMIEQQERMALARRRPGLSPAIVAVIERCLTLLPADRFRNGQELVLGLAEAGRA